MSYNCCLGEQEGGCDGHGVWERAVRCIKSKHLPGTTVSDQVLRRHEIQPLSWRPERGGGEEGGEGGGWERGKGREVEGCNVAILPCLL